MGFLNCALYMALIGIVSFVLGRLLPKHWFHADRYPFKSFQWEKGGSIYNHLQIRKWQNRVPDMSRIFPRLMQPKKLQSKFQGDLPLMIQETCIAEAIHFLLCFAGLYCLKLWPGIGGAVLTVLYIVVGNVPFILIQRYNRPRLCRLQAKLSKNNPRKELHSSDGNTDLKLQYRAGT